MEEYSFLLLPVLSFVILFALQYVLLAKTRSFLLRNLPWLWVIGLALFAGLMVLADDTPQGAIDFMMVFAILVAVYAFLCAVVLLLARLVRHIVEKRGGGEAPRE